MLKPSGGFLKKVFSAPAKAAGAIAGGVKKTAGAVGGAVGAPMMAKKKAPAGPPKGIFAKAMAGKKG